MAEERRAQGNSRELATLISAVILIAVAMGGFYYIQTIKGREDTWVELAHSLSTNVNEVAKVTDDVARGVRPDFPLLRARVEDFDNTVLALRDGDPFTGAPPVPAVAADELAETTRAWGDMKRTAGEVTDGEQAFKETFNNVSTLVYTAHPDSADGSEVGLADGYEQILRQLAARGAGAGMLAEAAQQVPRLERLVVSARRLLADGRDAAQTAKLISTDLDAFDKANTALSADAATRRSLESMQAALSTFEQAAGDIVAAAPTVDKVQLAAAIMRTKATNVISTASALEQKLIDNRTKMAMLPYVFAACGLLAIVLLVAFIAISVRNARARLRRAEERDARQQHAILSLLDEITNLADGDLTVDVTVTEDFTGAIADSINYTVQNMRNLVGTIHSTSADIAASASSTREIALRMNQASERQAKEIAAVTNTIADTSQSMQKVAGSAEQLAQQAEQSVGVARNGADTVNRTIVGMTALREQIQDTSKRIKRLGESSQEIGNIIEFINDIAEQTNTLALNASIQAAMAGEAGRGFAVVADEVQHLAERAANATRQIETLVKTIQADTNETIISMERSTQNVVSGAKSAEEAGLALTMVETSSQELAKLITDISASARNQSAQATRIAGTMQVIRDIAVQTSGSANQTAGAVEELSGLSVKLRESVAGFKLPEDEIA